MTTHNKDTNPQDSIHSGEEAYQKVIEEQVEEFVDEWVSHTDDDKSLEFAFIHTQEAIEVKQWLRQALFTAREEGEKRGLEKSQVVLDGMMKEAKEEGERIGEDRMKRAKEDTNEYYRLRGVEEGRAIKALTDNNTQE